MASPKKTSAKAAKKGGIQNPVTKKKTAVPEKQKFIHILLGKDLREILKLYDQCEPIFPGVTERADVANKRVIALDAIRTGLVSVDEVLNLIGARPASSASTLYDQVVGDNDVKALVGMPLAYILEVGLGPWLVNRTIAGAGQLHEVVAVGESRKMLRTKTGILLADSEIVSEIF